MPNGGWWQTLLSFVRDNEAFIEISLFVFAFAESIVVASSFAPATLIFLTVGALEGAANGPLLPLILAGALGAMAGDLVSFGLGLRFYPNLRRSWPLDRHPRLIARGRHFMSRWGLAAIGISKLSGPLRPLIPMMAGASRMPRFKFLAASAASSLVWASLTLVPPYLGLRLFASA
ncbi:MAG: DedA family protein [Hyphomicrobiaceae bacterium]